MSADSGTLAMILVIALITAASRVGGYWLSGRFELTERMEVAFNLIPGTILTALVAPAVVAEGLNGIAAVAVAAILMRKTGNLIATLIAGVGVLWFLREAI